MEVNFNDFTQNMLLILFGTGTLGGIAGTILKFAFNKALVKQKLEQEKREIEQEKREKARIEEERKRHAEAQEYNEIVQQWKKAMGRLLFWLVKGIRKLDEKQEFFNGDLSAAWADFKEVEEALKKHEQKIISQRRSDY